MNGNANGNDSGGDNGNDNGQSGGGGEMVATSLTDVGAIEVEAGQPTSQSLTVMQAPATSSQAQSGSAFFSGENIHFSPSDDNAEDAAFEAAIDVFVASSGGPDPCSDDAFVLQLVATQQPDGSIAITGDVGRLGAELAQLVSEGSFQLCLRVTATFDGTVELDSLDFELQDEASDVEPNAPPAIPSIALSANELSFAGRVEGDNPAAQTVNLTNPSGGSLVWIATADQPWLKVSPSSGVTSSETDILTVSLSTTGLALEESPLSGQIQVLAATATNSPQSVSVTLELSEDESTTPPPTDECETLDEDIREDTTLAAGCYLVPERINVIDPATLTLMPGVTMIFARDTGLDVELGATLLANGSANAPIVLTGEQQVAGFWDGLGFIGADGALNFVTIEYAGARNYSTSGQQIFGGLVLLDGGRGSRVNVTNCTVQTTEGYGFWLDDETEVDDATEFDNNTFTQNVSGAGIACANVIHMLDGDNDYQGNDLDAVVVSTDRCSDVQTDQIWKTLNVPYVVRGDVGVDALLTIEAGTTIQFASNAGMNVFDNGRISAEGSASEPIVFEGQDAIPGAWDGLRFTGSDSPDNRLDFVTIRHGGGRNFSTSGQDIRANLVLEDAGSIGNRVAVTNCTFEQSASYGFWFDNDTVVDALSEFSGNTVTGNTDGAGLACANVISLLDSGSSYVGNDRDVVVVSSDRCFGVATDQTWNALDADYLVPERVDVEAALTVSPGAVLRFGEGSQLRIESEASLTALGTAEAPIVFQGDQEIPGFWFGIGFIDSGSFSNQLAFVEIAHGGGGDWSTSSEEIIGNLALDNDARVTATNCTFRDGNGWGIWVDGQAMLTESGSTFTNNAFGDTFVEP